MIHDMQGDLLESNAAAIVHAATQLADRLVAAE